MGSTVLATIERRAVLRAVAEAARSGPELFLLEHGFRPGTRDVLEVGDLQLPPKAVLAIAHRYQHGGRPLRPHELSGGLEHAARRLVHLGFRVRRDGQLLTHDDVEIPKRLSLRALAADLRLYACRPTSSRAIEACKRYGFGTLISPIDARSDGRIIDMSNYASPVEGLPHVIDNGAWACHKAGIDWQPAPMMRLVERIGPGAGWLVLPDIVSAGEASLRRSIGWLVEHRSWLRDVGVPDVALAVQDGMTPEQVRPLLEQHEIGVLFVGGSAGPDTPNWKWRTLDHWAELGLDLGIRVHVGRVNGLRRALLCRELGVTSIDGSCVTRYSVNAPTMARGHDGIEDPAARDVEAARHACRRRRFELALGSLP